MERRAGMEDERAGRLGVVDARRSACPCRRAPGSRRRRARSSPPPAPTPAATTPPRSPGCARGERLEQVALEPREERLRLRVAEAAVELEHARPVGGQHQPGEEHAGERRAAPRELCEHRAVRRARRAPRRRRPRAAAPASTRPCRPCSRLRRRRRSACSPAPPAARAPASRRRARRPTPPRPRAAPRRGTAGRAPPPRAARRRAPSWVWQTQTPLPAASPSALTTHGGRATASVRAVGTPAASKHVLREGLRPLDPRRLCARAEDGDARGGGARRRGRRRAVPPARRRRGRRGARRRAARATRDRRPARDGSSRARRFRGSRARRAAPRAAGCARAPTRARAHVLPTRRAEPSRERS